MSASFWLLSCHKCRLVTGNELLVCLHHRQCQMSSHLNPLLAMNGRLHREELATDDLNRWHGHFVIRNIVQLVTSEYKIECPVFPRWSLGTTASISAELTVTHGPLTHIILGTDCY